MMWTHSKTHEIIENITRFVVISLASPGNARTHILIPCKIGKPLVYLSRGLPGHSAGREASSFMSLVSQIRVAAPRPERELNTTHCVIPPPLQSEDFSFASPNTFRTHWRLQYKVVYQLVGLSNSCYQEEHGKRRRFLPLIMAENFLRSGNSLVLPLPLALFFDTLPLQLQKRPSRS